MIDETNPTEVPEEEPTAHEETQSEEWGDVSGVDEPTQSTDEVDEDTEGFTPAQRPVDYTVTHNVAAPSEKTTDLESTLTLFRESYSTVSTVLDRITSLLESINTREESIHDKAKKQGREVEDTEGNPWFRSVMNALTYAQLNEMGENALARDGSAWSQTVDHEGQSLRAGQPKQKLGAGKHSAEETMTYLTRRAGVGTVFDVPLYHSGVWLRLRTPPLSAITGLQYQMQQLKVTLGSDTKGMAFSNVAQVVTSVAVDFALQYVISCNVHYTTPSDLKEKISLLDVPSLLWGMAVTLWPKGYPYAHPCMADPETCQHVTRETLNLNRLFWTDTTALTAKQRKQMSARFAPMSNTAHAEYLDEHVHGAQRLVWFGDLGLTLKVPTLQTHEEAGKEWIDGIVQMTQGAFNEPPHGSNRDQYITRLGMATTARQYSHWVASIHERDEDGNVELVSDDAEVLNEALNHVFSTDAYVDDFFGEITRYMDDSLISMVAIPSFNCPQCDSPTAKKFHKRFDHLVPLDVLTTFFTLASLKLS